MVDGNDDDNRFEKMEGDYELGQWILTGSSKKKSGSSKKKKNSLWLFDLPKQFDTKGFAEKIKQLKSFTENRPNMSSKSLKIFEFNLNGKSYEIDEEPIFHVQNSIALIPSSSKKKNEEDGESGSRTKANNLKNACFSTGEFRRSFIVRERQKTNTVLETTRSNQKKKKKNMNRANSSRAFMLLLYLLRAPFYQKYTKNKLMFLVALIKHIPLLGSGLLGPILEITFELFERRYFATSAS
mmetsp:Transcript_26611/g.44682  ORF Transcript_26611/g.44682 Transcript_26611/m.44682 type:complete len:240 (+) Transcript_26611:152-871(+)